MTTMTMAFANQKGGVAKTTTVVNVAACMAESGRKVLVVDLDPQTSATSWLSTQAPTLSAWDVLAEESGVAEAVVATVVEGVDLLGADEKMFGVERAAGSQPGMEMVLAGALREVGGYDVVLIDCPPALGLLTVSALVAAQHVVIPVTMDTLGLGGVAQLVRNIERVTTRLNPALSIAAIVPCLFQGQQVIDREVLAALVEEFGDKVTHPVRKAACAKESPGNHQALTTYAPTHGVTADYRAVTAALISQGETR